MGPAKYEFGAFVFDERRKVLTKHGRTVALGRKALILLEKLLVAEGSPVSKSDLMEAAWPGTVIEESNLAVQIAALRKCLGTTSDGGEWITTVQRVGYQFTHWDSPPARAASDLVRDSRAVIAVLPFENLSSDPEQDYFADGLAQDLITDLSKVPGLVVIASHSSFAYRGSTVDLRQIAGELGARYVVEGNVRRAEDRVRINANLVDATRNSQMWAERFDAELRDIFALQDRVVARIVDALSGVLPGLSPPSIERPSKIEAHDLFVRGRLLVPQAPARNLEGRKYLEAALALEPEYADAHAWLAASYHFRWAYWNETAELLRPLARRSAAHAVDLDPRNAVAHSILGTILLYERDYAGSLAALETALEIDPSNADAWLFKGDLHVMEGRTADAIDDTEAAMRVNPHPPGYYYWFRGFVLYAARRYEEAIESLDAIKTSLSGSRRILAASLAQLGQTDRARQEAGAFLAANPLFSISHWATTQPFRKEADLQLFMDGYRKAGLPA
jgi:TolB-like protein